jgi:hypothetical protein
MGDRVEGGGGAGDGSAEGLCVQKTQRCGSG